LKLKGGINMKIRKIDYKNEPLHLCKFCDCVSDSTECEEMFEIKEGNNSIFICDKCLENLKVEMLKISCEIKDKMKD